MKKDLYLKYKKSVEGFISLHNIYQPTSTNSKRVLDSRIKNMRSFLDALDAPDKKMNIVHITGTSGKGTVAKLIQMMLTRDGKKTSAYISPHTTTFLERFIFQNNLINPDVFIKCIAEVTKTYITFLQKHPPLSFFDLSTALGLYAFEKAGAEYCVLEVGCGGRYDGTNAIATSQLAIITNVSKDHTEILGDTLEAIAHAKAGIIKKGGNTIVGESRPRLKKVFCEEAVKKDAALFFVTNELHHRNPNLAGKHGAHNAAIAVAAAKELHVSEDAVEKALSDYQPLPCRFEVISKSPFIILDGAHNPAKVAAGAELARRIGKKLHVLYSASGKKELEKSLKLILPVADRIHATRFTDTHRKAQNPSFILKKVPASKRGNMFLDPKQAVQSIAKNLKKDEALLVTGSLYTAGEIRSLWMSEKEIVQQAAKQK